MSAVARQTPRSRPRDLFVLVSFLSVGSVLAGDIPRDRSLQVISGRTMGTTFTVKFLTSLPAASESSRRRILQKPSHIEPLNGPLSRSLSPSEGERVSVGRGAFVKEVESEINRLLEKINRQMSTYLPDSELSQFNACGHTNWFPVSREVVEVFENALALSEASQGAFDITVGPLVNLWGFGPEKRAWQVPEADRIAQLLRHVGYNKVFAQTRPPRIRKTAPEVYCDLSAIAKGHGVDRVAQYLEAIRVQDYLVQIGGEVRAKGKNPEGQTWNVGIQDPRDASRICRRVQLQNQALSTSGDYVQSFEQNGRKYSHTIDPRTGRPVTHALASVSVVHDSSAMADAWATALNVLGSEAGFALAAKKGLPVLMVLRTPDGYVEKMTPDFLELIAEAP
ncbi:MAG: FAD:protein FMN transferase [Verrucomicrobia bacterium]|nr:FAD:protein FMN transferase [Verrucomicrobiota bacterium]